MEGLRGLICQLVAMLALVGVNAGNSVYRPALQDLAAFFEAVSEVLFLLF